MKLYIMKISTALSFTTARLSSPEMLLFVVMMGREGELFYACS